MATANRRVMALDKGGYREEVAPTSPAQETEWARNAMVGPLRKANVAIPSAAVALTLGGVDADAGSAIVMPQPGKVVGLTWGWTAAPTHVLGTVQATKGGTAGGDVVTIDGAQTGSAAYATPLAFAAGDSLGAKVTTDANFLPANDDLSVWLVVRYDP